MINENFGVIIVMIITAIALVVGSCQYSKKVDAMVQQYGIELQNQNRR